MSNRNFARCLRALVAFSLAIGYASWSTQASADTPRVQPNEPPQETTRDATTAIARPWTVRLDGGYLFAPNGLLGLTAGYMVRGRVAIEYSTGWAADKAWNHGVMVRPRLHLTRQSSLFFGAGSSFGISFRPESTNTLINANAEIGYELRDAPGLTFLVALGASYHITTYRYPAPPPPKPGDLNVDLQFGLLPYGRIGLGWTF